MSPNKVVYIIDKIDYEEASDYLTVTRKGSSVVFGFEDTEYFMNNYGNGESVVLKTVNKDTLIIDGETLTRQ